MRFQGSSNYVSTDDLTLAVNLPDGTWECNDDAEGLNPGLGFDSPMQGLYNVWVGSFRSRARTEAAPRGTLFLSGVTGPVASTAMFDEGDFEGMPDFPEGYSGGEGMPPLGVTSTSAAPVKETGCSRKDRVTWRSSGRRSSTSVILSRSGPSPCRVNAASGA